MRLQRRPQGRIPVRLAPTKWEILIEGDRYWTSGTLVGLHHWLIENKPADDDLTSIWRNDKLIYEGTWKALAGDGTLW